MTLVAAAEVAGLVVAIGGAGAVLQKGLRAMRRFARFLDSWFGDGSKHPSVPERLDKLETAVTEMSATLAHHVDGEAPTWLAEGQAWGNRLDEQVAQLDNRVTALESGHQA